MSIAAQVAILFLVVLVGVLCRRLGYFTDETIRGVTQLVVNVTLPVLTVYNMQRPFDMHVMMNFLLTLLLSLAAILAAIGGASLLFRHRPHDKRAVLLNMAGFSNCGFMGYPIILAINPDWMIYAVAYNVAYLLVSWTVGVSLFQGRQNVSLKRVLLNPNVIAAFLGFAVFCLHITLPDILSQTMSLIGGLTTPLSMLLIGTRISGIRLSELRDKLSHHCRAPPDRSAADPLCPPASAAPGSRRVGHALSAHGHALRHAVRHAGRALRRRRALCRPRHRLFDAAFPRHRADRQHAAVTAANNKQRPSFRMGAVCHIHKELQYWLFLRSGFLFFMLIKTGLTSSAMHTIISTKAIGCSVGLNIWKTFARAPSGNRGRSSARTCCPEPDPARWPRC